VIFEPCPIPHHSLHPNHRIGSFGSNPYVDVSHLDSWSCRETQLTAFEITISRPPNCSIVVFTTFLQSACRPASWMHLSCTLVDPVIGDMNWSPRPMQKKRRMTRKANTYTLNDKSFHIVLSPDSRFDLFGCFFVGHIVDGDVTPLGSELLGHESSQPPIIFSLILADEQCIDCHA
jgi:hypothetical protein